MKLIQFAIILFSGLSVFAQDNLQTKVVDSLYREDHFYVGLGYNSIHEYPPGLSQTGFSLALRGGYLRDIPLNKKRTFAIAPGIGLSYKSYNQNLKITKENNQFIYEIGSNSQLGKNRLSTYMVEIPIEIRWRNSTPDSHRFFRVYSGFSVGYVFYDVYLSERTGVKIKSNDDLNKIQYGAYIATGYNMWNVYAYYGLNSLYKSSAKIDGKTVEMSTFTIGLIFYIL